MKVSKEQLAKALEEWHQHWIDNPDDYKDMQDDLEKPAADWAAGAMENFVLPSLKRQGVDINA